MSKSDKNARGFTLIEILVVVGIIAILISIVTAVGLEMKSSAQRRVTTQTLHTVQGIYEDYMADNGTVQQPWTGAGGDQMAAFIAAAKLYPKTQNQLLNLGPKIYNGNTVVDGYYTPIQFHATGAKAPYFESAGPDLLFSTSDDIFSYDPQ